MDCFTFSHTICSRKHHHISLFNISFQLCKDIRGIFRLGTGNLYRKRLLRIFLRRRIFLLFLPAIGFRVCQPFRIGQCDGPSNHIWLTSIFWGNQILCVINTWVFRLERASILIFDFRQQYTLPLRVIRNPFHRSFYPELFI